MLNEFKVGDRVKICWKEKFNSKTKWMSTMDTTVGKYGFVYEISQGEVNLERVRKYLMFWYPAASLIKVDEAGLPLGMLPTKKGLPCIICGETLNISVHGFCVKHRSSKIITSLRKELGLSSGNMTTHFPAEKIREAYKKITGNQPQNSSSKKAIDSVTKPFLSSKQQEHMVHVQNKSLQNPQRQDWVSLALPDGRIASPPLPGVKDGWTEVASFLWPEKYEARAISDAPNCVSVYCSVRLRKDKCPIFKLDPIFMHDMRQVIVNEAVFVREAKRFKRTVTTELAPEPYDYYCPSRTPLMGKWPNYHPSGMVTRREKEVNDG